MVANHDILGYSFFAAGYLLSGLSERELKKLKSVLLFGSVAQGNATKESDIDLFFDVEMPRKSQLALRSKLNKEAENFYISSKGLEFKMMGIDSDISIKVGKLEEWADLAQSISSHGIVLYQRYTAEPPGLRAYAIFSWESPGKAKGALLNRLYGYRTRKKFYPGLLQKAKGIKIGKGAIMVPANYSGAFEEIFEGYKLGYYRHDVWSR